MSYAGTLDAPLFGNQAAPRVATTEMKRQALQRELGYRKRVYARRVDANNMTRAQADYEIWIVERILEEGFP
jgi:hypothetical protein